MCVEPVAKWPPARVAIQPPSVEYSNDCGKWRSVRPCGRSWSSSTGPVAPAWMRAAPETRVDLEHPVERAQVDRHGRRGSSRRGSTPPHDARAAAERDRRGAGVRRTSRAPRSTSASVARVGDHVGRVGRTRRGTRARCRGRPCRARAPRARRCRCGRSRRAHAGGSSRGSRQLDVLERAPAARHRRRRTRGARAGPPRPPRPRRAGAADPRSPSPSA